jgi:hypothetical protein
MESEGTILFVKRSSTIPCCLIRKLAQIVQLVFHVHVVVLLFVAIIYPEIPLIRTIDFVRERRSARILEHNMDTVGIFREYIPIDGQETVSGQLRFDTSSE